MGVSVGALVGGGSGVNGMTFDRGSKADYDAWETLGNTGWSWSTLLPYFKKSVTWNPPTPDIAEKYNYTWDTESAYGGRGPIQLSLPPYGWPVMGLMWEAWKQMGVPKTKEGANGNAVGVFHVPSPMDPVTRTRSYARTAHYDPYRNRSNYHLLTGHQVTEIRFVSDVRRTATGVNVVQRGTNGPKIAIQAKREVILAAGAVWTPWILQRSGFGPKSVLEAAGIPVKKDFPGVGANLQEHPFAQTVRSFTNNLFPNTNVLLSNTTFYEEALREYNENRTGPLTLARGNQLALLPLKTVQPQWEDIIRAMLSQTAEHYLPQTYDKNLTEGFIAQLNVIADLFNRTDNAAIEFPFGSSPVAGSVLLRTLSRGVININTSNPLAPPVVEYRTFSNPIDIANAVAAFKYSRKFMSLPVFQGLAPVETVPGLNVTSDEDIAIALKSIFNPVFAHPSGTAAMMPEKYGGVVGPDLRVYGARRLSIADASIMPLLPGTHICTTVYAVAEKASISILVRPYLVAEGQH